MVPASKCGSYTFISTLMPTAFVVHTVSGTATPASPPANVSPLKIKKIGFNYTVFGLISKENFKLFPINVHAF